MTHSPVIDPSVSVPIFFTVVGVTALGFLLSTLIPLRRLDGLLAGSDPRLRLVLKAVRSGAWQPAADLLAAAGNDLERVAHYAKHLSYVAADEGDAWVTAWQAARPDDSDAVLIAACTRVKRAWLLRGAQPASATSPKQFADFHHELRAALGALERAACLRPDDPTPWAEKVAVARGLDFPHRAMAELWAEVEARSPYHFNAHLAALQYFCAKWCGSRTEVEEFAERASRSAPRGHLLALLPLLAWYEEVDMRDKATGLFGTPEVVALVDAALDDVAAAEAEATAEAEGHPNLPEARHLLAYFLVRQHRYRAALEQFRHVDGYTGAIPWRYLPWGRISYRLHRARAVWGALLTRR
ncbi:hypothetical protein [Streptomyces sp. NPDC047014]|uniref:hypothetical protein n=1 Tax=Streptomyces sp. NPDC047014 TaxID=3155736 RepID=UPI0034063CFC